MGVCIPLNVGTATPFLGGVLYARELIVKGGLY